MASHGRKARAKADDQSKGGGFDPQNPIGSIILADRLRRGLTQDQYGARYEISGVAIFKFEKGYVRPKLGLWLRMAAGAEVPERRAVLLWLRRKLPEKYRNYVNLGTLKSPKQRKGQPIDYAVFEDPEQMHAASVKDTKLPKALRQLLDDDELWTVYKPSGYEINMLRDTLAPLGRGTKTDFREGLLLLREFTHSF